METAAAVATASAASDSLSSSSVREKNKKIVLDFYYICKYILINRRKA